MTTRNDKPAETTEPDTDAAADAANDPAQTDIFGELGDPASAPDPAATPDPEPATESATEPATESPDWSHPLDGIVLDPSREPVPVIVGDQLIGGTPEMAGKSYDADVRMVQVGDTLDLEGKSGYLRTPDGGVVTVRGQFAVQAIGEHALFVPDADGTLTEEFVLVAARPGV